jgi:hypothetical protein
VSVDTDLTALRAYLADFEAYLKSDVVFWTAGGNLQALTLGGLLLIRRTLAARRAQLSPAQLAELDRLESQASRSFNHWPVNIEKKALREISSRLNVWAAALDELGDNYGQAVYNRAYLGLLFPLVARQPEAERYRQRLDALDSRLRASSASSGFVWDAGLAEAFPPAEFWFLYRQPRGQK